MILEEKILVYNVTSASIKVIFERDCAKNRNPNCTKPQQLRKCINHFKNILVEE